MALPKIAKDPTKGKIIGYKKVETLKDEKGFLTNGERKTYILQLEIGVKNKRHFPEGFRGKSRADKARVVKVWELKDGRLIESDVKVIHHICYHSCYAPDFVYTLGRVAKADKLDTSPDDCGAGINFFLNVKHAKEYS